MSSLGHQIENVTTRQFKDSSFSTPKVVQKFWQGFYAAWRETSEGWDKHWEFAAISRRNGTS